MYKCIIKCKRRVAKFEFHFKYHIIQIGLPNWCLFRIQTAYSLIYKIKTNLKSNILQTYIYHILDFYKLKRLRIFFQWDRNEYHANRKSGNNSLIKLKFKRKKFNARGSLGNLKTSFIFSQFSCSLYYAYIRVVLLLTLNLTWHTTMYLGFILHSILWFAYNHKIIWISHTSTINIINEI